LYNKNVFIFSLHGPTDGDMMQSPNLEIYFLRNIIVICM